MHHRWVSHTFYVLYVMKLCQKILLTKIIVHDGKWWWSNTVVSNWLNNTGLTAVKKNMDIRTTPEHIWQRPEFRGDYLDKLNKNIYREKVFFIKCLFLKFFQTNSRCLVDHIRTYMYIIRITFIATIFVTGWF